ncbi:MAG: hypothetical protein PW734_08755 [Verrucomicrobium sp.]|nr:hypothetical protein [Verrucomicrobium sp.]
MEIHPHPTAKLQPAKWTGFDQFGLLFLPDGRPPILYHKHTTSARVGWNDPDWSPERNLPVVPFRGERIGFTSCHDLALSPLARALKAQEATIWVNPSGDNTRDYLWSDLLQARVAENGFKAGVCALHRDSCGSKPPTLPPTAPPTTRTPASWPRPARPSPWTTAISSAPRATVETVRGDHRADAAQTAFHRRLAELVAFAKRMERPAGRPEKISAISGKARGE